MLHSLFEKFGFFVILAKRVQHFRIDHEVIFFINRLQITWETRKNEKIGKRRA